jgi:hypothetical protein
MINLPEYIKIADKPFPIKKTWKIVAGPDLHPIQMFDLIYDQKDLRDRKMELINDKPVFTNQMREHEQRIRKIS